MATFTLSDPQRFPEGTVVGAYPASAARQRGAPTAAAVATATVTGGSATFTGLEDGRQYVAYASVNGQDFYRDFTADPAGSSSAGGVVGGTAAQAAGLPVGKSNHVPRKGLQVVSDFTGGEDGTGTDSTGRLNLYSFQRAAAYSLGENIRRFIMRADAKSMDAWYLPAALYNAGRDPVGTDWVPVVWTGAHWEANAHNGIHAHWSVEVPDATGALQTRFEVPFAPRDPADPRFGQLGLDHTNIGVVDADLTVYASTAGKLRVAGAGTNRTLEWSNSTDGLDAGRRWQIVANSTAEAGAQAGSDLEIRRFDDAGATPTAAMFIERKTGRVTFGGGNAITADGVVNAVWAGGTQGYSAKPSTAIGNSSAFDANLAAASPATDRVLQIRAQGDASSRFVLWGDGKVEWGTATGRDTNLYRSVADTLKTDDSFHVALTFRHLGASLGFYNAAAVAKPAVSGSRGANAALASLLTALATLGLVTDSSTA